MENYTIDILIIITLKLILLFGFFFLIKFWFKKSTNIFPVIFYWVFGLFFVFVLTTDIVRFLLTLTIYEEGSLTRDLDSLGSLSSIIGLLIYIMVGVKYFKRKKQLS